MRDNSKQGKIIAKGIEKHLEEVDICLRRALLLHCLGFGTGWICKGMCCFHFICIHLYALQCMSCVSVESD